MGVAVKDPVTFERHNRMILLDDIDSPYASENYDDIFPTKITQHVTDVDGVSKSIVTDLLYNRFGHITGIDTFPSENTLESKRYSYDGINRLKTENYERKVPAVEGQINKSYDYSPSADENGLFKTTIFYQDSFGNNLDQQTTSFYYDGLGQQVETWAGPEAQAILVEKIGYDEFGRKDFVEDGNNIRTEFDYDGFSRPKEIRFADGTKKVIDYNDAGRKVTEKIYDLDSGSYNLVGKSIKYFDNAGNTERIDQYSDVTESTVYTTRYAYNKADQLISVTDPRGLTLKYKKLKTFEPLSI